MAFLLRNLVLRTRRSSGRSEVMVPPRESAFRWLTHLSLLSNPTSATSTRLRVADVDSEALKDVSRVT
jgi:hypothetical protein